jgi:hypothetical protein
VCKSTYHREREDKLQEKPQLLILNWLFQLKRNKSLGTWEEYQKTGDKWVTGCFTTSALARTFLRGGSVLFNDAVNC